MFSGDQIYAFTSMSPPSWEGPKKKKKDFFTGCTRKAIGKHAGPLTVWLPSGASAASC